MSLRSSGPGHPSRPRPITRRSLVTAGAAATAALMTWPAGPAAVLAQTPAATREASPLAGGWTFTDDRGITVTLPAMPERVLAQINAAASLWDFGVRPAGIWGPARTSDGAPSANAGRVDLDAVTSVTEGWDEPDLERFLNLDPDLIVSTTYDTTDPVIWGIYPPEVMPQVEAIAPTLAIGRTGKSLPELLDRFGELAAALGADLDAPEVVAARAEFEAANDRLAAAIAANPDLRVFFGGATETGLWWGADPAEPDMRLYTDLGLQVVMPEPGEVYGEISWEQAGRVEADLILFDARIDTGYPSLEETIANQPLFAQHPAVVAGQVGPYAVEYVMSYQGATDMLNALAEAIEGAEPLPGA